MSKIVARIWASPLAAMIGQNGARIRGKRTPVANAMPTAASDNGAP